MDIIRKKAYARAGLVGNPSDNFNGKTISLIVRNFSATVLLYEWEDLEIVPNAEDQSRFGSITELAHDVDRHGYHGGTRLVKATIKRFFEYCQGKKIILHERNFSIRYETDIPRQVGLAGSSAIIVGALRCLMEFYEVAIPLHLQPSLVLAIEREELKIAGGLQDRVIQIYEGVMYMDFSKEKMRIEDGLEFGQYSRIKEELPPLYIAYNTDLSEPTEIIHSNLLDRYNQREPEVVEAMEKFATLAFNFHQALLIGETATLPQLIDENFDLRRSIKELPSNQIKMVETARQTGASAKFAGSGGAIVGTYENDEMLEQLSTSMADIDCQLIIPKIHSES